MTNYREILRLYSQGISQRNIAASCACSRSTVAKVLNRAQELDVGWPLQEGMSGAELHKLFSPEARIVFKKASGLCAVTQPFDQPSEVIVLHLQPALLFQ